MSPVVGDKVAWSHIPHTVMGEVMELGTYDGKPTVKIKFISTGLTSTHYSWGVVVVGSSRLPCECEKCNASR